MGIVSGEGNIGWDREDCLPLFFFFFFINLGA